MPASSANSGPLSVSTRAKTRRMPPSPSSPSRPRSALTVSADVCAAIGSASWNLVARFSSVSSTAESPARPSTVSISQQPSRSSPGSAANAACDLRSRSAARPSAAPSSCGACSPTLRRSSMLPMPP